MELTQAVGGHWRTIYMDNWFTSVYSLKEMLEYKTRGCGTTRANRGLPEALEKKNVKLENRGDFLFAQGDDGLLAAAWFDTGVVVGLSTKHDGLEGVVKRKVKGIRGRQDRRCPDIFVDYNKNMGGVDLADLRRAWHSCRLRAYKWWHPVFYWIIDSAMINAHILRNVHLGRKQQGSQFWLEVIESLLEPAFSFSADADPEEILKFDRLGRTVVHRKLGKDRLFGRHYLTQRLTADQELISRRCKVCMISHKRGSKLYEHKTSFYCKKCDVHLHWQCFESYHEDAEPKSAFSAEKEV
jgi:hypothetical protein